jgi:hypothetical protein
MGIQGKERLFSEDKPLKAPLAWHEIIRSEKQENKLLSSPDVFISKFEESEIHSIQLRYISALEGVSDGIPPGLYIESNIPPELSDDPILISGITFEFATQLAKQGKSKVTAKLPSDITNLIPELNGEQIDIDFGNAFGLKTVFFADHERTVFEITPLLLSQAVDRVTKAIKGEQAGPLF